MTSQMLSSSSITRTYPLGSDLLTSTSLVAAAGSAPGGRTCTIILSALQSRTLTARLGRGGTRRDSPESCGAARRHGGRDGGGHPPASSASPQGDGPLRYIHPTGADSRRCAPSGLV